MTDDSSPEEILCGLVALVGPPNAGKSTLLNRLLGQKISIVSPKPQTTRNRILGIYNRPDCQIVFLDTPGLHQARSRLNSEMVKVARHTLGEVDAVAYLIDVSAPGADSGPEQRRQAGQVLRHANLPTLLLCNKIDLVAKEKLLPVIAAWQEVYPFSAIIPLSALKGDGEELLLTELRRVLPTGQRLFAEDIPTNASERFICGEIIREKIMLLTRDELPYATAVIIDRFREEPDGPTPLTTIDATILVEKSSQKGIVIGSKGQMLTQIGRSARREIEALLGTRVMLKLWVKVQKNWTENLRVLRELGIQEG